MTAASLTKVYELHIITLNANKAVLWLSWRGARNFHDKTLNCLLTCYFISEEPHHYEYCIVLNQLGGRRESMILPCLPSDQRCTECSIKLHAITIVVIVISHNFSISFKILNSNISSSSCRDIKIRHAGHTDGKYLIDLGGDGQGIPFEAKCDMTSFGGGWTMCYTTDKHVNIKTELTTTPDLGYRADCNNIPVNISSSF